MNKLLLLLIASTILISGPVHGIELKYDKHLARELNSGWHPLRMAVQNDSMIQPNIRKWISSRSEKLNVLFVCAGQQSQYEMLAFAWAFDFKCDIVSYWYADSRRHNTGDKMVPEILRVFLQTRKYDAIVIVGVYPGVLPDDCEKKILELVEKDGTALIHGIPRIFPRVPSLDGPASKIMEPHFPMKYGPKKYRNSSQFVKIHGSSPIGKTFADNDILWMHNVENTLTPDAVPLMSSADGKKVLAALRNHGKGKIMLYDTRYHERLPMLLPATLPQLKWGVANGLSVKELTRFKHGAEYADQFYLWLYKALVYAAGKQGKAEIRSVKEQNGNIVFIVDSKQDQNGSVVLKSYNGYRDVCVTAKQKIALKKGLNRLSFKIPDTKYAGTLYVDSELFDSDGKSIDAASLKMKSQSMVKVKIAPFEKGYQAAETIPVKVSFEGLDAKDTGVLRLEAADVKGNLLFVENRSFSGKENELKISITPEKFAFQGGLLNLKVIADVKGLKTQTREHLSVKTADRTFRKYLPGGYTDPARLSPINEAIAKALEDSYHFSVKNGYPSENSTIRTMEYGFDFWYNWFLCSNRKEMEKKSKWMLKYDSYLYEVCDEPSLQFTPAVEAAFDRGIFRTKWNKWLKDTYGSIDRLNRNFKTDWKDFSSVKRPLWYDVIDTDQWELWFQSRRQLDAQFQEKFDFHADIIHKQNPHVPLATNPRTLTLLSGFNTGNFVRSLGGMSLYNNYVRGTSDMGYLTFSMHRLKHKQTYIGYTWASAPGRSMLIREAFDTLRRGSNFVWFAPGSEEVPPLCDFSYLGPDLSLNPKGKIVAEANRLFADGKGALALNCDLAEDGVLVYFPRRTFYVDAMAHFAKERENALKKDPKADIRKIREPHIYGSIQCPVVPILETFGVQYRIIDEVELNAEMLAKNKVLILNRVLTLSDREMNVISDFAAKGGIVIADAGCAVRDDNGDVQINTAGFEKLFGIARTVKFSRTEAQPEKFARKKAKEIKHDLGTIYRNGNVWYLNFKLDRTEKCRDLIYDIFKQNNQLPKYELFGNKLNIFTGIESNYTLKQLYTSVINIYGKTDYVTLASSGPVCDYEVKLPGEKYVYDLFKDKFLGKHSVLKGKFQKDEFAAFAISDSPRKEVILTADKQTAKPGDVVTIRCKLKNGDLSGKIFAAVETDQPKVFRTVPKMVNIIDGTAEFRFKIPYNVKSDSVKISMREFVTGGRAECQIRIR